MKIKPSRVRKRVRIEIIPMIDVMFFLLATFMLASLTLQNLHSLPVTLPRGEARPLSAPRSPVLTVTRDGRLLVDEEQTTPDGLPELLRARWRDQGKALVVNADTLAPNGVVIQAMLAARRAGAETFLFAVRHP